MTELTPAQTMAIDKIHSTIAERDRLQAINAELVKALGVIVDRMDKGFVPSRVLLFQARAALAKAKGE